MQLDVRQPLLLGSPGEGEAITDRPNRELRILCDHDWLTVTWTRHAAGQRGAEPHVHREHCDAFYVLQGQLILRVGAELAPLTAAAGTLVIVPPGVIHGFDNDGPGEARFLNFHAPDSGFAHYLRTQEPFDSFDPPDDGGRPASDAIVTPAGGGERFQREDRTVTILGEMPEFSVFRLEVEPEWPGIGAHSHNDQVDVFFVLEGEVLFLRDDGVAQAPTGTFQAALPGMRHGVEPSGRRTVFLNAHGPDAGFAESIRRL
ncbi:MAG TPA: cupin domain-containing protein [Gaiellaceae bacterium]|nr:cupin domain-containing protein [Gaiellaceae bacterium]